VPTVSARAIIPGKREDVFDFIADFRNIPRLQPQFSTARLASEVEKGLGAVVELEGRFRGLPMHVQNKIIAFDSPRRLVSISDGSVLSRSTWELQPISDESTKVTLTLDYKFKQGGSLFGGIAQLFIGEIQNMTDESLRRLKAIFEDESKG
jgi:ribosome-associated toxin RatA of RatAB toxin-antitoxin module